MSAACLLLPSASVSAACLVLDLDLLEFVGVLEVDFDLLLEFVGVLEVDFDLGFFGNGGGGGGIARVAE